MKQVLLFLLLIAAFGAMAQSPVTDGAKRWNGIDTSGVLSIDSVSRAPFTLVYVNKSPDFSPVTKQRMTEAFFKVYPQQVKRFNNQSLTRIVFFIDPAYDGIAATGRGVVRYNPAWFKTHPDDI